MKTPVEKLTALGACSEAVDFVRAGKFKSLQAAWLACERGDWMLWYAGKLSGPSEGDGRKRLVLAACECARLALPIFEKRYPDDKRVRGCLETAEKWARGEDGVTMDDVRKARYAAYAAYAYAAAAYAYAAAAYAAYAAAAAAYAYDDAAADAYAAAAYAYAAADDARKATLQKCADIVRKHYPSLPNAAK